MARKVVEQELNRDIILNVAREQFANKGYAAVSMRSIANAMGYSHGSLYYHFKEKAELFYALVKEDFRVLLSRQREIISQHAGDGLTLLHVMMSEFLKFGLQNRNQYEIMFLLKDADLQRYSRTEQAQVFELFSEAVTELLQERGEEDIQHRLYTLPWSLFMSLHGFITYCIRFNQCYEEVEKLAREHVDFLCRSI